MNLNAGNIFCTLGAKLILAPLLTDHVKCSMQNNQLVIKQNHVEVMENFCMLRKSR